ncbi:hypothetical protein [Bacillus sp. 03113]|uniref:hypothetical protein n=1 Tax=Bacillus sp. 03113 TaxID=2578211 RepID=UPI001145164B|nr:hypothetical protein [Bacillus sp. 03113]
MNLEYKAYKGNWASSHIGTLEDDTPSSFTVNFKEYTEEDNKWTSFTGLFHTAIDNWTRTRALAKVLQNKGLLEEEEYKMLIEEIGEASFEEMKKYILTGE